MARLGEELSITSNLIQDFIKEVLPKQSRRKKAAPNYGEAVLKQRLNPEDGTSYFSLNANLSDKPGSWLESKLKDRTVGQVLEQAAAWEQQSEERRHDMREGLEAEVEQQARSRFEMLEFGLKQKIAHLEAQLAVVKPSELAKVAPDTGLQSFQAPETIEESTASTELHSARTETVTDFVDGVALAFDKVSEALEAQIAEYASVQPSEPECDPVIVTNCLEPVAPITHSQPSDLSAAACQLITLPWEQIKQIRDAESYVQLVDSQIQELNSKLAKPSLDRIVERELKDVLRNRQNLRITKISQIVNLADSNSIPADYEQLRSQGRVVLAAKYASEVLKQAKSWADVVLVVGGDYTQLKNAVVKWTLLEKQLLVQLLTEYLETEPSAFDQIDWIPEKLLWKTLSTLSFTLEKIRSSDNLVDEPEMEKIRGCKFKSVSNIGNPREQWFFQAGDKVLDAFGRSGFSVEKF